LRHHIRITKIDSSNSKDYVILIHGLGVTEKVWFDPFRERLWLIPFGSLLRKEKGNLSFVERLKDNFGIISWTQKRGSTIEESARELFQISKTLGSRNFFFLAHSRGGLVARYAVQKYGISPRAIICLSTPHYGSNLANIVTKRKIFLRFLCPGTGKHFRTIEELKRDSPFLCALNEEVSILRESLIPHFDITGNRTYYFRVFGLNFFDSFESFFRKKGLPEIVNGSGDGFVSIDSARSPLTGPGSFYILPVNHLNILVDRRAQDIVIELLQKFT
jgi:pimeloyl-ACP methyl ester carboxylesterase